MCPDLLMFYLTVKITKSLLEVKSLIGPISSQGSHPFLLIKLIPILVSDLPIYYLRQTLLRLSVQNNKACVKVLREPSEEVSINVVVGQVMS